MATLKFADKCPDNPFQFTAAERNRIVNELRKSLQPPACDAKGRALPTCANYAHIGVFFDGTNNNKYFSTKEKSHSNVARLYDVFPGKGVLTEEQIRQTARVYYDSEWEKRTLPVPSTFAAKEKAEYFSEAQARKTMYRKIYVPGVGTPFRQVGDENDDELGNRLGEAVAKYGNARIIWAMLQVLSLLMSMSGQEAIPAQELDDMARKLGRPAVDGDVKIEFYKKLNGSNYLRKLQNDRLPKIEAVNLYVFGFSRGAAAARSFCTRMRTYLAKLDIKFKINIKFLGLFDTVASVGSAHSSRALYGKEDGHHSWAAMDLMFPSGIDKTVHLVAAHEVRGSFPITSIAGMTGEEIVFPGVHSDVGGGYAPTEQGKSVYVDTDTGKLSQIPLSVMYRKAVMAGVPFLLPSEWQDDTIKEVMKVDPVLIRDFNSYRENTDIGGKYLRDMLRKQYAFYIRWRKMRYGTLEKVMSANLAKVNSKRMRERDVADLRDAEKRLGLELAFLNGRRDPSTGMPYRSSQENLSGETAILGGIIQMMEKVNQWEKEGIKKIWNDKAPPQAAVKMFEQYVHDSVGWFRVEPAESWGYLRWRTILPLSHIEKTEEKARKQAQKEKEQLIKDMQKKFPNNVNLNDVIRRATFK
ncbi:T6SS phospholipase effector Tle1-like catalytic domain-containing protein [Neisseria elongata]|jgi:conserved hypothethical protein|uniref:T6SS phospholipase effector Tle1-like catalytic domain-containing protein n=1 Tax=Neisseria elongata TaxID=495 RepID=UPI00195635B0|nr:DUF2235 domain-containing protein [Neisseria elongata]MBM7065904.1 DUF2235 domain-containing protein [Neisseria elongata]